MFNVTRLLEKQVEQQKVLFHNFVYFTKALDRVEHECRWRVLKEYDIDNRPIKVTKSYDEATSAALPNRIAGDFIRKTVGVWQGCPLSPVLSKRIPGEDNAEGFETSEFIGEWMLCWWCTRRGRWNWHPLSSVSNGGPTLCNQLVNQSKPATPGRRSGTRQMFPPWRPPIDACPLQPRAMTTSTGPSFPWCCPSTIYAV